MLNDMLTPRLLSIIVFAELVLAIFASIYIIFALKQDWQLAHQPLTHKILTVNAENSAELIDAIPNVHLFGKAPPSLGALPLSSLQFKITGIAKEDNKTDSKAYLSLSGGPSKIFRIGDNLPYGVKVYDITADSVVLENDGHLEKLTIPREKLKFKPRPGQELNNDA